jgi:hypothetical protein
MNLVRRLANPNAKSTALLALALSGNATVVPALLPALKDDVPAVRKLALQAIAAITGLSLDDDAFILASSAPPSGSLPPIEDDPEAQAALPPLEEDDLDVAALPAPEDALDEPNAEAIAIWWEKSQGRFSTDQRLLCGQPFSPTVAANFLQAARLRLRHVVALSVAIRSGGQIWPDTRGFSGGQKRELPALANAGLHLLRGRTAGW